LLLFILLFVLIGCDFFGINSSTTATQNITDTTLISSDTSNLTITYDNVIISLDTTTDFATTNAETTTTTTNLTTAVLPTEASTTENTTTYKTPDDSTYIVNFVFSELGKSCSLVRSGWSGVQVLYQDALYHTFFILFDRNYSINALGLYTDPNFTDTIGFFDYISDDITIYVRYAFEGEVVLRYHFMNDIEDDFFVATGIGHIDIDNDIAQYISVYQPVIVDYAYTFTAYLDAAGTIGFDPSIITENTDVYIFIQVDWPSW
jgi:hypothetical protein